MKRTLLPLALAALVCGCGGGFPTASTGGASPTPTPAPGGPTPTPGPGGSGSLDLSGGAPVGTIYFTTNYGRSLTSANNKQIYAVRSDGSGRVLIAESGNASGPNQGIGFRRLSPDGKWLIIDSFGTTDADRNVFLTKADGSGKRTLVAGGFGDATFSPDSRKVLIASDAEIVVENVEGGGKRSLSAANVFNTAKFSPDGARIAYRTGDGLFVENADGTGKATLIAGAGYFVSDYFFRADGQKVAAQVSHPDASRRGIYVVPASGSGDISAASPALLDTVAIAVHGWSPDGKLIYAGMGAGRSWYVAGEDGSGARLLASWQPTAFTNLNDVGEGVLSPDNSQLVYSSGGNLFRVLMTGGTPQQLTNTPGKSNFRAVFNSDGTKISFLTNRDDRGDVPGGEGGGTSGEAYVMNADGSGQTRLTESFSANSPEAFRKVKLGGANR